MRSDRCSIQSRASCNSESSQDGSFSCWVDVHAAFSKVPSFFQGGKIRSTYVAFAQKEKIRLEESIASLKKEVEVKRAEADRTNGMKYACLVEAGCNSLTVV